MKYIQLWTGMCTSSDDTRNVTLNSLYFAYAIIVPHHDHECYGMVGKCGGIIDSAKCYVLFEWCSVDCGYDRMGWAVGVTNICSAVRQLKQDFTREYHKYFDCNKFTNIINSLVLWLFCDYRNKKKTYKIRESMLMQKW